LSKSLNFYRQDRKGREEKQKEILARFAVRRQLYRQDRHGREENQSKSLSALSELCGSKI